MAILDFYAIVAKGLKNNQLFERDSYNIINGMTNSQKTDKFLCSRGIHISQTSCCMFFSFLHLHTLILCSMYFISLSLSSSLSSFYPLIPHMSASCFHCLSLLHFFIVCLIQSHALFFPSSSSSINILLNKTSSIIVSGQTPG